MILIADSGATKTDWRLISDSGQISQAQTGGMNPFQISDDVIKSELQKLPTEKLNPQEIFFYGAGCSSEENRRRMYEALSIQFPTANVAINHDIMGAARALCGHEEGIACILGTGANSCQYDGKEIIANVPSLGFVLGDEGSGAYFGKMLMAAYLRQELPQRLQDLLTEQYGLTKDIILHKTYSESLPARFLGQFSHFIAKNLKEPSLYKMVYRGFELFMERNVMRYEEFRNCKAHFVGSVAYFYANILRKTAQDKGIIVGNIIESPIAGLTLYHQKINL